MNDALETLASEIDSAASCGDVERLTALSATCGDRLESATGTDRVILRYFEANTHGAMADAKRADPEYAWSWQQPEVVSQVLALRRAIADPAFPDLDVLRQGQIRTNLGKSLSMHREEFLRPAERDAADNPLSVPIPSVPIEPD